MKNEKLCKIPYYEFIRKNPSIDISSMNKEKWTNDIVPIIGSFIDEQLLPFQRQAIYQMISMRRCINAASMGLGKTLMAITSLLYLRKTTNDKIRLGDVIICPGYLRVNWRTELEKWCCDRLLSNEIIMIDKAGKNEIERAVAALSSSCICIISYDMFANIVEKQNGWSKKFNTVIIDESHFMKEIKTKRFKQLSFLKEQCSNLFLLSGTPSPNRSKELFAQYSLLHPHVFKNYYTFTQRYSNGHYDNFNHYDDRGISNEEELALLTSKIIIRMRREEYLAQLPEETRHKVILSPNKVPKSFIKTKHEFISTLQRYDTDARAKDNLKMLASKLFLETVDIKLEPVIHYLQTYVIENEIENEKTIIFCKHHKMKIAIEQLLTSLSKQYISISGETDIGKRGGMITTFKENSSCTYAILTIGSCSTGLTLTPIRKMIFTELTWSPSELAQCEARINRIGGAQHLTYSYLLCDHTVDEMVFNKLKRKVLYNNNTIDMGKNFGDFEFDDDINEPPYKKIKNI
jgi:SWI/SNF-related matrix-associated actin-dependent regulator 1 of chromatin subfamily A